MKTIFVYTLFFVLFLSYYRIGNCQNKDSSARAAYERLFKTVRKTEILTGINFQTSDYNNSKETRRYFELGIARSVHSYTMHGPTSFGVYVSEEVWFGDKNIYGTKIGAYTHYFFDIGCSLVYYTDFNRGNLKLRPEFGVGLSAVRIVGGYNIPTFANKAFAELRKSNGQLTIQILWPVKKRIVQNKGSIIKALFKN